MAAGWWVVLTLTGTITREVRPAPPETIVGKDGATMVLVRRGPFIMGTGRGIEQKPEYGLPHVIDLPAFYIDREEVTNARYAAYMAATGAPAPRNWAGPRPPAGRENHPVTDVTWFEAMKYAIWAGKRLPTEAEWEKAARGTDGRQFPWGDSDDKNRRNLDTQKLEAVGQRPEGASPWGCLDMCGNAWEWTADWFLPYPITSARSVHFGRKYKVIRGGGAEYFYAHNDNSGRCAVRARILPYGSDDYLGFRCAQSAEPDDSPYEPAEALAEAEKRLGASLHRPVPLTCEAEYDDYLKARAIPLRIVGADGQRGYVRQGVPFPRGLLKDTGRIRVAGPDGRSRPVQATVLTTWQDGSARWVLVEFAAESGETCRMTWADETAKPVPGRSLRIEEDADRITLATGKATAVITRDSPLRELGTEDGVRVLGPMRVTWTIASAHGAGTPVRLRMLPAAQMEIEDRGPLHATVRLQGGFADADGRESTFRYDLRIHAVADSARLNMLLTVTNFAARTGRIEDRTPMTKVLDATVCFPITGPAAQAVFGTDRAPLAVPVGGRVELLQRDHLSYAIIRDGKQAATGTRAPGWVAVASGSGWVTAGVRHFWQNYAKSLAATPNELVVRLWAGAEPLEWEATLAKTHEIIVELSEKAPTRVDPDPLRAGMPPAWACGTKAIGGPLLPRSPESLARLPYWETLRDTSMRHWLQKMRYGFRDFGDARHGGETKGKNAFNNLEYDVHYNFLLQFLRTGETWYLDSAEVQARHQADIDTDHVTGQPYKHHPFHTTERAEIGHVFLRGLVTHYWLTGERRSLEVARRIGDYLAAQAAARAGFGNERQIGWGLYGLTGIYEATLDDRYLKAAAGLCDALVSGQSPSGKFNIRYDNRISFMNGIAMHGMVTVQELTGDEKLAEGIQRLARRTLGLYPEYAMRTLNAYAWLVERTSDPRYLDVMERTLEASMEFHMPGLPGDATTSETHAWRFPWFACKYQLFPLFEKIPADLPSPVGWRGLRIQHPRLEMFIRPAHGGKASVLVMLEGLAGGRAELLDRCGKSLQVAVLDAPDRQFQPVVFPLPDAGMTYFLRLETAEGKGWHLQHDASARITFCHPTAPYLENLYPRAFGFLEDEAGEVAVRFEAMGEGYHSATLYDPDGNPVAATERFVDLDDRGRYEVELRAPITDPRRKGWSLVMHQARVLQIRGFLPYWAASADELFHPERRDQ